MTSPRSHSQERGSQDLDPDYKLESRGVQSGGSCGCFQHDPEDQQGWEERVPGVAGGGGHAEHSLRGENDQGSHLAEEGSFLVGPRPARMLEAGALALPLSGP